MKRKVTAVFASDPKLRLVLATERAERLRAAAATPGPSPELRRRLGRRLIAAGERLAPPPAAPVPAPAAPGEAHA